MKPNPKNNPFHGLIRQRPAEAAPGLFCAALGLTLIYRQFASEGKDGDGTDKVTRAEDFLRAVP
jgi:hypothetical protein